MHMPDFYFEQLVTEAFLDLVFGWVEEADLAIRQDILNPLNGSGDPRGAIHRGGEVTPTAAPSMAVKAAAIYATDPDGRRVYWGSEQNVDCSVDYLGVTTDVSTGGNEKYLGIFAEFDRELTEQKIDGNGVPVWTQQLESFDIKVYQGTEATIGSALPPTTPTGMIRLANVRLVYNQTQILTADIEYDTASYLREDWVRMTGAELGDFVHGIPSEAIEELFVWLDDVAAGNATFTSTSNWHDGSSIASTVVAGAINEIVSDLAATAGADRVGAAAHTTSGGYADLAAGSVQDQHNSLADDIDGHIAGGAPNHPATAITTAADTTVLMYFDDVSFQAVGTTLTNEDDGQCVVAEYLSDNHIRVRDVTGTWTPGAGVDVGGSYVAAEFYYNGQEGDPENLATSEVQTELEKAFVAINARAKVDQRERITERWNFDAPLTVNGPMHVTSLLGGTYPNLPLEDLIVKKGSDSVIQSLAYEFQETVGATNVNDMCKGIVYNLGGQKNQRPCIYVSGYDDNSIQQLWIEDDDEDINEQTVPIVVDAVGTPLPSGDNVAALACNGEKLFILVDDDGAGTDAYLVCLNMKRRGEWEWTYDLTGFDCGSAPYKRSNMQADANYVWMCFGGEAADGTPLARLNVDGTNIQSGSGDWSTAGYTPCGGFSVTESRIWFTVDQLLGNNCYLVAATLTCGAPGVGTTLLNGAGLKCRSIATPGRFVVCPLDTGTATPDANVYVRDTVGDIDGLQLTLQNLREGEVPVRVTFDGHYLWFKCVGYYTGNADSGPSKQCLIPVHLSQIQGASQDIFEPRFFVEAPTTTGNSTNTGLVLAWGPGIWMTPSIGDQQVVSVQMGTGLIIN